MSDRLHLFLGGQDAEMAMIRDLAAEHEIPTDDKDLRWGNTKASAYATEIAAALAEGETPVLIELDPDLDPEVLAKCRVIDHHGARAKEKASILQFIDLAGIVVGDTRSRLVDLIAANDSTYIPGMLEINATPKEIMNVRALERAAQGITTEQEEQAEAAIASMERFPGLDDLIVIHLAHSKTATVTDRLFGTQQREHILILSGDGEVNYYGDGAICAELKEQFQGWNGRRGLGDAGDNAYWGGYPDQAAVTAFIKERLTT